MAIPQPQTGSSLPGRSPAQPARPISQTPSGEKDLTKDPGVAEPAPKSYERPILRPTLEGAAPKKADSSPEIPIERPPVVPTFKPRVPLKGRDDETKASSDAKGEDAPADDEWKLPAPTSGSSTSLKVALGVVAAALIAGGYVGYTKYWPRISGTDVNAAVAGNEENGAPESDGTGPTQDGGLTDDPFSGDPPAAPATGGKPRIAHHTPDAAPISSADVSKSRRATGSGAAPAADIELPLDLPTESETDAVDVSALHQDEPELESESEMPMLASPKITPGNAAPQKTESTRPTVSIANLDADAEEDEEADIADDPYTIDADRATSGPAKNAPPISIVDVDEEEADESDAPALPAPQRAVSKTVVVRSTSATEPPAPPVAEEEEDKWTIDESPRTARKPAVDLTDELPGDDDAEVSAIRPKGSLGDNSRKTPAAAEASTRSGVARSVPSQDSGGPTDESYTVAPNDNFWTISRRQYGSGRYFAALARHNQERVPDPQRLRPGMQISTPPVATLESRYGELIDKGGAAASNAPRSTPAYSGDNRPLFERPSAGTPSASSPPAEGGSAAAGYYYSKSGEPMYRVSGDDTLGSIAQKHLGRASRWTEIYELNRETLKNPENLTIGTAIRLPPDASKVGWLDSEPRQRR
jgi:nucleoid-associated protein YgaU